MQPHELLAEQTIGYAHHVPGEPFHHTRNSCPEITEPVEDWIKGAGGLPECPECIAAKEMMKDTIDASVRRFMKE
jgi:hypothetical protein